MNFLAGDGAALSGFNNFQMVAPVGDDKLPVRRLDINGAANGKYFEYPQLINYQGVSLFCEHEFADKVI